MKTNNGFYKSVEMRWDSMTFPVKAGTPISAYGVVANDANAIGIIPQAVKAKPADGWCYILVGGEAIYETGDYTGLSNEAIKSMGGINIYDSFGNMDRLPVYVLPAATATALGGVKQAENVAASEATDVAGCVTSINAILTALKGAGIMVADEE